MSIKGQGHSLTLVRGHSDVNVQCLTFGLYTQASDSGPYGPLVSKVLSSFLASGPCFVFPCCYPDVDRKSHGLNHDQTHECLFKNHSEVLF